jgi:hypothetical protein
MSLLAKAAASLRPHFLIVVLLALVIPAYFAWAWGATVGQLGGDGPSYLMMANHYAHGHAADSVYSAMAAYSRFPPLYPLLLSWCHAADDFQRVHAITTSCLILALIALYAWLFLEGMSAQQSTLLVLLFAALPGSWLAALTVQTEYLYMLWSLLAIALMVEYQRSQTIKVLFGAAIVIALATLTRAIGITLFAPFLILLLGAPRRAALTALLLSILPLLIWHLLHHSGVGYIDALAMIYSGNGLHTLRSQLTAEIPALRIGFGGNFLIQSYMRPVPDILGTLCLAGTAWRTIKLRPDAIYISSNLPILLVWPYPEEAQRFLWVLVPLLIAQPILAVSNWRREKPASPIPQLLTGAVAAAILVTILPALALASDRYRSASYTDLPEARSYVLWYSEDATHAWDMIGIQTSLINSMYRIAEEVPADDCVISTRPDLINYFGRRRSYFPPLNSTPEPYFGRQLRAPGCHFAFGMASTDERYAVPLFPLGRMGSKLDIVFYSSIPFGSAEKSKLASVLAKLN